MNYHRGFQRFYAVVAIAWVATLLFVLPSERLRFWSAQPNGAPAYEGSDGSGVANVVEIPASSRGERQYKFTMTDGKVYVVTTEDTIAERPPGRLAWLAAWLFAPPMLAYGLLFVVLPWVLRGFQPAKEQI